MTIACIGSGNMGYALMKAVNSKDTRIIFTDLDDGKARAAAASLNADLCPSNIGAVKGADYVFLAVKPQVLEQVLAEVAEAARDKKQRVFVSMAAGWSIKRIQNILGAMPVARIMPNTPALVGKGMISLAASPQVDPAQIAELENILHGAGLVERLDEGLMDAATGLSGSAPAFVYLFIEALADGGVKAGLPRDTALRFAAQTVLGSAAMVQETGKHPGELKDMVTSPGGTTIAGIAALEEGAFRGTVIKAVEAAWKRAAELKAKP
jgi:pyrroline-5-carboxylate reductase